MLARPHKGVFWLIDGKIWAVPFDNQKYKSGISKSGDSYVHRKIWKEIKPRKCRYPYNYYPRGRVQISSLFRPYILHLYWDSYIEYIHFLK